MRASSRARPASADGPNVAEVTAGVGFQGSRGPFFYVPVVLTDSFPWAVFLFAAAWSWLRDRRATAPEPDPGFRVRTLLWLWIAVIVLFFSFSASFDRPWFSADHTVS